MNFEPFFNQALPFDEYVAGASFGERDRWKNAYKLVDLDENNRQLLNTFTRKMNILVLSGIWCGDCVRQGPILQRIREATTCIDLRFIESHTAPELQAELQINAGNRVPVVVVLSEDFFEVSRFGDRHLSAYRRKAAQELGPSCDTGFGLTKSEITTEIDEWVRHVERDQLLLRLSSRLRAKYRD